MTGVCTDVRVRIGSLASNLATAYTAPRMRRSGRVWRVLGLLVVLAATWGFAVSAFSGDAVVAKALLESGKKALAAKKYDEAIPLFRKALAEDPTLIEATYWRAQVHEKAKDDASALAAYREFLDLYAKKAGITADDQKLKALAEKRVEALAVAEREFQKLEEKYVADLLALAKAKVASDPGAALAAANRVLEIAPKNAEALALRDRLGEKKTESPFAGVEAWRELVKDKSFRTDSVKYPADVMTIDLATGAKFRPEPPVELTTDYAAEMEVRIAAVYDDKWFAGFTIGETKEGYFTVSIEKAQVRVLYYRPKQRPDHVASHAIAPPDLTAWHRLGLCVHGARIEVYLDGEKVIDESQSQRVDFSGELGVGQLAAKAEYRMAHVGSFK